MNNRRNINQDLASQQAKEQSDLNNYKVYPVATLGITIPL
jgi:hypothetical protein